MDITVEREGNTDRQPAPDVTPEPIFRVASEFVAARHLFVAKEVGLFEEVTEGPATLDELARRSGVPRRTLRIFADAMVATYLQGGMV
jgi:transcriptional regulator GlxA family with amidase domain